MTNTLDNQNTPDEIEQQIAVIVGVVHKIAREGGDDTVRATKDLLALITAARIAELEDLLMYLPEYDESEKIVEDRIRELQATLTNDKIGGEHGGLERPSDEK